MNVLYYTWNENSQIDMTDTLRALGFNVTECSIPFCDYEKDDAFVTRLNNAITSSSCDFIFSFDFFPMIAKVSRERKIKYVSWVYDSPHYTLFSPAADSEYSYIFVFDRMLYHELVCRGVPHVFHFPLAVNTGRLNRQLGGLNDDIAYRDDISFVGSLYENNLYDKINYLPDRLRGYIDGIMASQKMVYGYNFVRELIAGDITGQLEEYVKMNFDPSYCIGDDVLYSDMINQKITSQERISALRRLSVRYPLTLYTASDASLVPDAKSGGTVSYMTGMPDVFRKSKINLNITLRSIESGMPLRALDIMGAGGFLLSNYQEELAANFVNGEELVLYDSEEDMIEKAEYYLNHEVERKRIAYRGYQKTCELFSYEKQVSEILKAAEIK